MLRRSTCRITENTLVRLVGWTLIALALTANPVVLGRLVSQKGAITSVPRLVIIVLCEVLTAAAGMYVVRHSGTLLHGLRRLTRQEIAVMVGATVFAVIVGDVSLNLVCGSVYKPTRYGWTMSAYSTRFHTVEDQPGHTRTVQQQTFKAGFKRWGNPHTSSPKVLILGDSFTEMKQVSNGEEWYAYLEKAFPAVEWFVYGQGGYGSLQEYMILHDYIDEIRPHLILWQLCDNDYGNNLYAWDRKTYPRNNFRFRPYLENDRIVYRLPLDFPSLRKYSKTADLMLSVYDTKMKHSTRAVRQPTAIEREQAYGVTRDIFTMARRRAPDIPFFLFSVSPFGATEAALCAEASLTCIPGVWEHLERQKATGIAVEVVNDGHWNSIGNRVTGEYLVEYFRQSPLTKGLLLEAPISITTPRPSAG
jgi:hypothetical protein